MASAGRQNANDALLIALACGATIENAARKASVSSRTAHRRLADPAFRRQLGELRSDMVQRAAAVLTAAALEAVKTLMALQDAVIPPAVRLGAARAILELGPRLRESAELETRIATLEEQLDGQAARG